MTKKKFAAVQKGDFVIISKRYLAYWDKFALSDCYGGYNLDEPAFAMRKMISMGMPYIATVQNKNTYGGDNGNPAAHVKVQLSPKISFTTWLGCEDLTKRPPTPAPLASKVKPKRNPTCR